MSEINPSKYFLILLSITFLVFFPVLCFAQVILSEIMFDPSGSEYYDEFIEIYNTSETDTVDLSGWQISDGTGSDFIIAHFEGTKLAPGQFAVILDPGYFTSSDQYDSLIPENALILTIDNSTFGSGGLSNSTPETIILINSAGDTVARYMYSIDNEPGHSDEKIQMTDDDSPDNWANSKQENGTPGFRNSVSPLNFDLQLASILFSPLKPNRNQTITANVSVKNCGIYPIANFHVSLFVDVDLDGFYSENELFVSSENFLTDLQPNDSLQFALQFFLNRSGVFSTAAILKTTNDENPFNDSLFTRLAINFSASDVVINEIMYAPFSGSSEWIEIYNRLPFSINLQEWTLSDQDSSERAILSMIPFEIPSQSYALVAADSSVISEFNLSNANVLVLKDFPGLNNNGDAIFLFDANNNVIDQVNYLPDWGGETGVSLERINPDISSRDSSNWASCVAPAGATPGARNSIFVEKLSEQATLSISPNPFSPDGDGRDDVTIIQYNLPFNLSRVNISIFDSRGRLIRTLTDNQPSGTTGSLIWDGRDNFGHVCRVGIYIVLMEAIHYQQGVVKKMRRAVVVAKSGKK